MNDNIIKLKYLVSALGETDVAKELRLTRERLIMATRMDDYPLPLTVIDRIKRMFSSFAHDELMDKAIRAIKNKDVLNYDNDDTLTDVKLSTSRHGSNRSHASTGRNNNGLNF